MFWKPSCARICRLVIQSDSGKTIRCSFSRWLRRLILHSVDVCSKLNVSSYCLLLVLIILPANVQRFTTLRHFVPDVELCSIYMNVSLPYNAIYLGVLPYFIFLESMNCSVYMFKFIEFTYNITIGRYSHPR